MRLLKRIFAPAFFFTLLGACSHTTGANGIVISKDGKPLDSVKVVLSEDTGSPPVPIHLGEQWTNSAGRFYLEFSSKGAGRPHDLLLFSKEGYADTSILLYRLDSIKMRDSLVVRMRRKAH